MIVQNKTTTHMISSKCDKQQCQKFMIIVNSNNILKVTRKWTTVYYISGDISVQNHITKMYVYIITLANILGFYFIKK